MKEKKIVLRTLPTNFVRNLKDDSLEEHYFPPPIRLANKEDYSRLILSKEGRIWLEKRKIKP